MRILVFERKGGASGYITESWMNALRSIGLVAQRWDGSPETWQRFKPDLYIGCSGHRQNIPPQPKRGSCKIAIHVNPRGSLSIPGIDESADAIGWTQQQRPDAVFGYGFEKDRRYWDGWDSYGIPWVPMATAGDVTKFKPTDVKQRDIVYLGGRWSYKAKNIDAYLIPYLQRTKHKFAVYGWGDWPKGICRGELDEAVAPEFLSSGKVAPCISEPHTTKYGIDIPERVFKVILSGAIAVHDSVAGLSELLPNLQIAKNPSDYWAMLDHSITSDERHATKIRRSQLNDVLRGHTYHHRLSGLLGVLGFKQESAQLALKAGQYLI